MKKILIFSIFILIFISCSSDNNPIEPIEEGKSVTKVIQTRFTEGKVKEKIILSYKDNKLTKFSFYSKDDALMGYTDFLYNNNQLLSDTETFLPDGTLQSESHLTYDNKNRIIQEDTSDGNYFSVIKFTHNNDNTITVNKTERTGNTTKTFHINKDGLIYKESVDGQTVIEIIYDGNNPTSMITNRGTINYTYDEVNLPKGFF